MPSNEEWEEIEKSIKEKDLENYQQYGTNLKEQLKKLENKKSRKNKFIFNLLKKIPQIIIVLLTIFCIYKLVLQLYIVFSNMKNAHDANVEEAIEISSDIDIKLISKNVDEKHENGEYYFEIKKFPEITFRATKYYGKVKDDLTDHLHKYLFEHWNDKNKDNFTINEKFLEDGFLRYEFYITINTYNEMLEGTETIIRYLQYIENWNKENKKVINVWYQKEGQFVIPDNANFFLEKDGEHISPYNTMFQTADEIRENSKIQYIEIIKRLNGSFDDIPNEVLQKYMQ